MQYCIAALGAEWRATLACQMYFWGTKEPMAADMEGAKLETSQWVYVDFSKSLAKESTRHKAKAHRGSNTVPTTKFLKLMLNTLLDKVLVLRFILIN